MSQMMTPVEALRQQLTKTPDRRCMIQPLGNGEAREYCWKEVWDEAARMAAYIQAQGFEKGTHIALLSKNCSEWLIADLAIWMSGCVSVPLYPTLAATTVEYILNHSDAKLLFVGKLDTWDHMKEGVPSDMPGIAFSLSPDDAQASYPLWKDVIAQTEPLEQVSNPSSEDMATIIYTSGTTGQPKGVMHNFAALMAVGAGASEIYEMSDDDRMISYLPLSHVAERAIVETSWLYNGMELFFAESLETFAADIQRARPTVFFAVPRIWTKFYQKVCAQMPPKKLKMLLRIPLLNRIVKKKLLTAMGLDQCRLAFSGAAPLAPELIRWYQSIGLNIYEGYGMTENFAWSHTTRRGEVTVGAVGRSNPGVKTRICEETGEILVHSPGTMLGYYKDDAKTAESLTEDGFLHTGDKGEVCSEGKLRITGRIKDIFKSSKGKYIAPAPIENLLARHPALEQVCVVGANLPSPLALAVPSEEYLTLFSDNGLQQKVEAELSELLGEVNQQVDPHERLTQVVMMQSPWTVENGIMTPTLKIKRNIIEERFSSEFENWQGNKQKVLWIA